MNEEKMNAAALPFLLEIGSEEIPARFIPEAMAELEERLVSGLREAHLRTGGVRVMATPRRMVFMAESLDTRQPDREVEIKGPPVSVAFDEAGEPTPAGLGFARKAGVELSACERGQDQRGEYLVARRIESGRPAAEVLGELVPAVVLGIPFRKVMRWGDHELEYPRPLQWILALLGEDVVPLEVGYLRAGRASRGHRTLAEDRPVEIQAPGDYLEALRAAGVIVDQDERRQMIVAGIARELAAYDHGARLLEDEELLTEVVFICEYPTPFLGSFSEEYFALPAEVITTALKAHQRYFSVGAGKDEGLLPRFVAVRDGGAEHIGNVVTGNERVLRARLADALFYWEFDQRQTPDQRTAMLGHVTWLEGFGTVLDKTRRLGELVQWLWENGLGDGPAEKDELGRAAEICKSDLVSEMIKDGKEFTKLEGFIGARYARLAGESEAVCGAIERHYHPRSATGELPGDRISNVLSIADRLDNVAGCWLAGFAPTGAKDPYALRRHVLATLRILLEKGYRLDLGAALTAAMERVAGYAPERDSYAVLEEIGDFMRTRMERYFADQLGCDAEVLRAVLPVRWRDPVDALAWVRALEGFRDRPDFQKLATGFKRCRNILKGEILGVGELDRCLDRWLEGGSGAKGEDFAALPETEEQELLGQVVAAAPRLAEAEAAGRYAEVFAVFSDLGPAIDTFFDTVRVNVDEEELRRVRLAFLREIQGLFARFADFAEVAPVD
jgi:glycyl-tRNA synthetase beta chain